MIAPQTEEDLMSDVPPSEPDPAEVGTPLLTRRALLASGVTGAAAAYILAAPPRLRAAIMSELASGTVTVGSNATTTPVERKAFAAVMARFTQQTGIKVKVNSVDHNTFQEQINSYLQGTPQDVFTWFAGYRMQFFAQKGLLHPIDDVWQQLKPDFSPALQAASKGLDGHFYFVPYYNYPWAVHYQKTLFKQKGYKIPKTWDQFIALAKQMKADGTPMGFTDRDGWPAMGTFDYLNMRINGYDFHINLMHGKESWDSAKVKSVFNHWRELLPYYNAGALGKTWQEGAADLQNKKTGMFLLGTFVGSAYTDNAAHADLDFFPFPQINPKWQQDSVEAPIDGFLMSRKPKNIDGAKALMKYLGSPIAGEIRLRTDPNLVATNKRASTAHYNALQKKSVKLIAGAKHISQYMDRDTRPDFASTVMIQALQRFLNNPNDVNGLVKSIEKQKKAIFTS
jgi:multiple sugar transport system substrate-binding protein